jgi:pilus assembly protein CpaB
MKSRRVPLIIAALLALGTGALLLGYLTSLRPSTAPARTVGVLVATHDIPAGAAVTADMFALQQRIASQVDPDAISDPKMLSGTYTLTPIPAGGVATRSRIALESAATLPARLPVGMRAATIMIDDVKGVAGLIAPGDRVDVIAIPAGAAGTPRGIPILRDVLVLALGSDVATATAPTPAPLGASLGGTAVAAAPTTVTLELTPNEVDLLDGADLSSTLRLALRNPKEPTDSFPSESLTIASSAAGGKAVAAASHRVVAQPNARPAGADGGVIVIDGDHVEGNAATP